MSVDGVGALERGARRAPYRETVEMLADALGANDQERSELHAAAQRPRRVRAQEEAASPSPSGRAVPNNLPTETTSLRGRDGVLADCRALMHARFLTITGAGGVGKTRVAIALARSVAGAEPIDGVWFVGLESLASSDLVAGTAAHVLGVSLLPAEDAEMTIARALSSRRLLLLLDNCEHVPEGVGRLVDAILSTCPNVRILATSRRPLGGKSEATYRLPSLQTPPAGEKLSAADALRYGAVALFVDRAAAANSSFAFTDADVPIVVDICHRIDGIALALELAAARLRVLSLASLAKHLDARFRLLTAGSAASMARQRTLSALLDWSYDLLSVAERTTLNRSAAFPGGFDLDAARGVCGEGDADVYDVLDLLTSLVDQSLVVAETARDRERYRLLESTRAYALERLEASGEAASIARRHATHFAALARAADATYGTVNAGAWLAALEPEIDNFRRSLNWAVSDGNDIALGGEIAGSLERFWMNGGLEIEGRRRIEEALARIDEAQHPRVAARLWRALAWLGVAKEKYDAAERASELYTQLHESVGLGDSLRQLAIGAMHMGRLDEAVGANNRALSILRTAGDRRLVANCLDFQGTLAWAQGRVGAAKASFQEALSFFRALGSDGGVASVLVGLSNTAFIEGDTRRALEYVKEAHAIRLRGKNALNLATDATMLCAFHTHLGEQDEARSALAEALRWSREAGSAPVVASILMHAAAMRGRFGDAAGATRLMGYATRERERLHLRDDITEVRVREAFDTRLHEQLDAVAIAALMAEGGEWSEDRAVREALSPLPVMLASTTRPRP